jgi:hypothetical protein
MDMRIAHSILSHICLAMFLTVAAEGIECRPQFLKNAINEWLTDCFAYGLVHTYTNIHALSFLKAGPIVVFPPPFPIFKPLNLFYFQVLLLLPHFRTLYHIKILDHSGRL